MYEATVTAKNRYGTSEMSEAFQFYTLGPGRHFFLSLSFSLSLFIFLSLPYACFLNAFYKKNETRDLAKIDTTT